MGIFENRQNLLGNLKTSALAATVRKVAPFVIAGTIGYSAADLTVMSFRPDMLPTNAPPLRPKDSGRVSTKPISAYDIIAQRNIFNDDGIIPPALSAEEQSETTSTDEATLSQLPLTLQGTIVHFNPQRSIGTIRLNSKNITESYFPGEEIEGMARVTRVERRKVFIENLNNGRPEYIEIPEKDAYNFSIQSAQEPAEAKGPVAEVGRFNYNVKRSEVERLTSDIAKVLQDARMEPRFGPDNSVDGFCFVSIKGDSIYETLGFRVGDCISSVNGEPVTNPQKAMELYQGLRTSNNIQLGVDRDGRSETFNYNIN